MPLGPLTTHHPVLIITNMSHHDSAPALAPRQNYNTRTDNCGRMRLLFLSSSLLTDRILRHSSLMSQFGGSDVRVWTSAEPELHQQELAKAATVEGMPTLEPFREFPYAYLRRLNDFAWDRRLLPPSRVSMMKHVRKQSLRPLMRSLTVPASAIAALGLEERYELWLEGFLLAYERSPEATRLLKAYSPDVVVTTGPQRYEEPAIVASAKRLGIPTVAFITSWDNITTKNRIPFRHERYLVWSAQMKDELLRFYPYVADSAVSIVGAPQFDVFFQERFHEDRAAFCNRLNLRANLPIILYALGSPNFLKEHHGALALARIVEAGDLGDVQLLVRPHPLFDRGEEAKAFERFGRRVRVQRTGDKDLPTGSRAQGTEDITDWVNTFRHADVVVNLSSTATVDAAICDKPVVNLDFDPEPGQPHAALVHDVNHVWTHFKPIAESGGVRLVGSVTEMVTAIREYLEHPETDAEKRHWIVNHVCGRVDGRAGARFADAVLDFAMRSPSGSRLR
jgi:CDP-Glycerol:Poly(glycerophosphate) glycerophosphotransferase